MFYTRSENPSTMSSHNSKMNITGLPTEVLVVIFRKCSYREVAERLRPVCRRFSHVAAVVLNSEFSTLGKRIVHSMEVMEQHMKQTRTVPQFLTLSRISNALEIVRSRYRLLRAVTWRYVSSHYSGSVPLSCFYGGRLLDKFLRILQLACESSGDVKFGSYNVRWISDLCTRFMDHFEDITEPQFNTDYSVSGSKIIDLLDCIMDDGGITGACEQTVTVNKTECNIRALYRLQRTWINRHGEREAENVDTWTAEQKHVYRWLRRLITLNNDYVMSQTQFERERAFPDAAVRPEPASYSKCHRFSGQVFSCGTMNTTKFSDIRLQQHQMKKLLGCLDEDPLQPFTEPPPMDLNINIEIQCPLQLAPNEYLEKCKLNNFESDIIKPALLKGSQSPFFFKMDVCGPSWNELSLPSSVELEISSSNFRNDKNLCVNTNEECVCKSV